MAAATAAVFGLWATNSIALSLGRITVQSSIGEPLRAEIEIPEINAEEASTLKATVASPEAFRAAGLEYNAAMSSLQVSMQRRPDGRAFIRLSSDRTINEPFVDMIIEASWASGRIVRDYTMLFDPPNLRAAAPATQTPAQLSPAATATPRPQPPVAATASPTEVRKPSVRPAPTAPTKTTPDGERQVKVKVGDTASKIAAATKPANVSLDQMLVALLRANPDAFIGANINRMKAGAVLDVPNAEQAGATPSHEASQMIVAQSKDFNDFRRKLAGDAPTATVAAADRKATGTVQAKVEDKKPGTAAPDKLTLSKGAVQGKPSEVQIAMDRSAKEAASRAAELSKNIAELGKIGATSKPVAPAAPASPAKATVAPTVPVAAPVLTASAPTPVAPPAAAAPVPAPAASVAPAAAPVPAPAPAASAAMPAPAASVPVKRAVAPAPPPPEPDVIDGLLDNPLAPAGAVGLIALLAGFGFYRMRQRKKASQVDSAFLESRLQPDSFFGTSGGQRVDTNDSAATGSSMVYSPSQLDAADDVDPVAEADVYLAYGRDLQAEEILKEALRTNSSRIAIHQKLLEIYAKRRDTKGFEGVAGQAYKLTGGDGADWARICELGLSIDPTNGLYQPGGQPSGLDNLSSRPAPLEPAYSASDNTMPVASAPGATMDLDLDLDFSLDDEPASAFSPATSSNATDPTVSMRAASVATVPLYMQSDADATAKLPSSADFSLPDLEMPNNELTLSSADAEDFKAQAATSFGMTTPVPLPAATLQPAAATSDAGMLEFDLESLSLDLGGDTEQPVIAQAPATSEDPLATKLALAEEFSAIGDADGARALIEEVIEEASGDMKAKAQRALSNL
ncbi:FimV/HubP family polar landmark protein [Rhodoferax sp.]|uniref:FimV/HubP family polar landmark protein n=1 Tax=Rhodoferax sp. TaxID=50421 RepID=UPI0027455596|nr:FimV/HubP family polar landmark protein [Rhodoferax sp.]